MNMWINDRNLDETLDPELSSAVLVFKLFCMRKTNIPNWLQKRYSGWSGVKEMKATAPHLQVSGSLLYPLQTESLTESKAPEKYIWLFLTRGHFCLSNFHPCPYNKELTTSDNPFPRTNNSYPSTFPLALTLKLLMDMVCPPTSSLVLSICSYPGTHTNAQRLKSPWLEIKRFGASPSSDTSCVALDKLLNSSDS